MSGLPGAHVVPPTAHTLGLTDYLLVAGQRLPPRVHPVNPSGLARRLPTHSQTSHRLRPNRELSTTFAGGAPGVAPAGIITTPPSLSEPGIRFVSGSGPHNGDGEELGHKFSSTSGRVDALGVRCATLRRAWVGTSTGHFAALGTVDLPVTRLPPYGRYGTTVGCTWVKYFSLDTAKAS